MKLPSYLRGDGPKCIGIVLLVVAGAWWSKVLLPVVISVGCAILLIVVGVFVAGYLMQTSRLKSSYDLPESHQLNDARNPDEWKALEGQLIRVFKAGPDDSYRAIMVRFAQAINAMDADGQATPSGLACVITRKMLYEYQRRTGSLYFERFDERTAMSGPEVLRKLLDEERPRFLEFCRSLDAPTNVTPTTAKPDHLSTAEMAPR